MIKFGVLVSHKFIIKTLNFRIFDKIVEVMLMKIICALNNKFGDKHILIKPRDKYGIQDLETGEYKEITGTTLLKYIDKDSSSFKNLVKSNMFSVYEESKFKESVIQFIDFDLVNRTYDGHFNCNITQLHENAYAYEFEIGSLYIPIIIVDVGYTAPNIESRVFLCGNKGKAIYWNTERSLFKLNLYIHIKEKLDYFNINFGVWEFRGERYGSEVIICTHELTKEGYKINGVVSNPISNAWVTKVQLSTNFNDIKHDRMWLGKISW